jgi:uncharacterized protein
MTTIQPAAALPWPPGGLCRVIENLYGWRMQLTLERPAGLNVISAVSPGEVRIGGRQFRSSVIVGARDIIPDWPVRAIADLEPVGMAQVYDLEPEIIILGTGRTMIFPDREIHAMTLARNMGLEVMDTAAACRTFNILVSEERNVVAALVID